jgi:class 3 adenylate cyclase
MNSVMADDKTLKQIVQSLSSGIAIVDPKNWAIVFENAKFFQWFPPGGDDEDLFETRLPELDLDRARTRISAGRPFTHQCEVQIGARALALAVEIKPIPEHEEGHLLIECRDVSKQKETEYMLESYSKLSERNTRDLQREKDRVEKLLLNVMPKSVYEEMKDFGSTTPQRFESASVLMLDFVGFTEMAVSRDPTALIAELNDIFSAFDRIAELFNCERIKTIGDAYMAVSGMPEVVPEHPQNIAKLALRMKRYLTKRNKAHPEEWRCRIGINTGPIIGSIVGIQKYVYDIFGPGVNLASRMEAQAEPMTIALCEDLYELIKDEFIFAERGEIEIKGFGSKKVYVLEGEYPERR